MLSGKPNQRTDFAQSKAEQQPPPTTVTTVNNNTCTPNTGGADNSSPQWYASPEWWLVLLGFPTLFFLGWQANESRKAGEAARDSAMQTGRSVAKMHEANRINREGIQAGERAYISYSLSDMSIFRSGDSSGNITHWHF